MTRASSLLQLWRKLEGDNLVSYSHRSGQQRNASDLECLNTTMSVGPGSDVGHDISEDADETDNQCITDSEVEHEDNNSIISERSNDLGEIERDRVRQIFQEWRSNGSMGHSSNGLQLKNRSGPQWLGEKECERVRIIREWAQMTAQQRNNHGSVRDGLVEVGAPIEQVRDGLAITHPDIGVRRPIRRLCGRQTLDDLLERAKCERKRELQGLLEQRPVSHFAHRNRIQAFLRGRFLRNERLIPDKRLSSVAATELGLLRQRSKVSGLREGFLSKLDSSASTSVNSAELDSASSDGSNGELESPSTEKDLTGVYILSDSESSADVSRSQREFAVQRAEVDGPVLHNDGNEQEMYSDNEENEQEMSLCIEGSQLEVSLTTGSARSRDDRDLDTERAEQELSANAESDGHGHGEEINTTIVNESMLETDTNNNGPHEVFDEHYGSRSGASYVHEVGNRTTDLEGTVNEHFDQQDALALADESQESVTEIEDSAWQLVNTVSFTGWMDGSTEEMARSWQETSANQWLRETSNNSSVEQDQMQESHEDRPGHDLQESHEDWPGHDLQEAIDSWLDRPAAEFGASTGRIRTFNFPDDDNSQSVELRELFSRRRVSSLLQSSFRESLDQVLQSHLERQDHVFEDWELDNPSSPRLVDQDQGQQNVDQAFPLSDAADNNSFAPSTLITAFQPLWDEELQGEILSHNISNQQLGMEWEVVNELRMDLARLQQRMNNMQSMLEACIDMQIELQRSVRQEVSAALNRSLLTTDADASKMNTIHDETPWDYVRKGICCLCRNSNIDSLLYRCGHMCICSKCAEKLVRDTRKCPMCQAPVVEAVRAYFTQ